MTFHHISSTYSGAPPNPPHWDKPARTKTVRAVGVDIQLYRYLHQPQPFRAIQGIDYIHTIIVESISR